MSNLRFAFRQVIKNPAFSAVAIIFKPLEISAVTLFCNIGFVIFSNNNRPILRWDENAATSTHAIAPSVAPITGSRSVMATNTASAAAKGTPMIVRAMNAPTPAMMETVILPET